MNGEWYAYHDGGEDYVYQVSDHAVRAGESYTLQLWARSVNSSGNSAMTTVEARLFYDSTTIVLESYQGDAVSTNSARLTEVVVMHKINNTETGDIEIHLDSSNFLTYRYSLAFL